MKVRIYSPIHRIYTTIQWNGKRKEPVVVTKKLKKSEVVDKKTERACLYSFYTTFTINFLKNG